MPATGDAPESVEGQKGSLVLYVLPLCFFCIKVRWAIWRGGWAIGTRNIASRQHADALLAGGGRLQVPCLRITAEGGDRWMYESDDIIRYLRERQR